MRQSENSNEELRRVAELWYRVGWKISDMLKRSREYQNKCMEVCTKEEYDCLAKAFIDKESNLRK